PASKTSRTSAFPSPGIFAGWASRRPATCRAGTRTRCTTTCAASPAGATTCACSTRSLPPSATWRVGRRSRGGSSRRNGSEPWRLGSRKNDAWPASRPLQPERLLNAVELGESVTEPDEVADAQRDDGSLTTADLISSYERGVADLRAAVSGMTDEDL